MFHFDIELETEFYFGLLLYIFVNPYNVVIIRWEDLVQGGTGNGKYRRRWHTSAYIDAVIYISWRVEEPLIRNITTLVGELNC